MSSFTNSRKGGDRFVSVERKDAEASLNEDRSFLFPSVPKEKSCPFSLSWALGGEKDN